MSSVLIRFKVTPDGGEPFEVACTSRDVLMWERRAHANSYARLQSQQDMAPMYEIAHVAARRLGLFEGDLPTFEATCDLEAREADEADVDPTKPARSTGRQSRSR